MLGGTLKRNRTIKEKESDWLAWLEKDFLIR